MVSLIKVPKAQEKLIEHIRARRLIAGLTQAGLDASIDSARINEIIEQTQHALDGWRCLAKEFNVSQANIDLIGKRISSSARATVPSPCAFRAFRIVLNTSSRAAAPDYRIWLKNSFVRGSLALSKNVAGGPCSTITPRSVK